MNLVIFNMSNYSDWEEGIVNRNFFITQELSKRKEFDKILLIDFLSQQPLRSLFGRKRAFRYLFKGKGVKKISDNVYLYHGLNLFTSKKTVLKKVQKHLKKLEISLSDSVLWSYNAFFPEVFSLDAKIKVFDAVDNWAHHASYKQEAHQLQKNYQEINIKADSVFTVSEGLQDLFSKEKVSWVPNGIDINKFTNVKPVQLGSQKKIIGYVGTIQERLDFDLIEYLLQEHQDKEFVFIGPVWKGVQQRVDGLTAAYSNIQFLGRKAYDEVPSYLAAMDVTIIPHRIDAFISSTNPMKMYDYLAAGKPVVTTPGAGTDMFIDLLEIHETKEAFSEAINTSLISDSQQSINNRKAAVSSHSWENRVNTMMKTLLK